MKKFAYIDFGGVLHITKYENTAKSHAKNGKYVETYVSAKGGYPVDEEGHPYIVYSDVEEKHGYEIPEAIANLYRLLK
jgi:hypothetical protein